MAALGLTLLALSGCVWSPTNRSTRESTDTLWLYGESNAAGQSIDLSAQNPHTGVVSIVGHATSATSMDSYGLYPWVATFTPAADFWAPQLGRGLAHSPGRVEITTQVHGDPFLFRTFSPAAQACTINAINAGQSALAAGNSCSDGTSLVVFDTNGVGNSTAPTPSTAWMADTAFFPVTTVPPGIVGGVPAQWQLGHYRMYATDDPSGSIDVFGVICRPIAGPGVPSQLIEDRHHQPRRLRRRGRHHPQYVRPESGPAISRPKDLTRAEVGLGEVTDVLCGLAQAAWVVPALTYSARYVGGGLAPPSDCAGTSLTWQYTPPTAWPGERHLIVYAGATHDTILVGAPWTDFLSFVQSLAF